MTDWQGQLEDLLASLNVYLDPNDSAPRAIDLRGESFSRMRTPTDELPPAALSVEEMPRDGDEVSAVRSEIEFTVGRVVRLERVGLIDRVLWLLHVRRAIGAPLSGHRPGSGGNHTFCVGPLAER